MKSNEMPNYIIAKNLNVKNQMPKIMSIKTSVVFKDTLKAYFCLFLDYATLWEVVLPILNLHVYSLIWCL